MVPLLLDRVKEVDSGCIVDWSNHEDNSIFKQALICPSATCFALVYSQPMIFLDACHTKNKKYHTQLFVAAIVDGTMQGFVMCYATGLVENEDNWTWFLRLLLKAIDGTFH